VAIYSLDACHDCPVETTEELMGGMEERRDTAQYLMTAAEYMMMEKPRGQITFYHYNGRPLSSSHLGEFPYSFTSVVRSEIHFYHFCTRGAPAQLATSAPSARRVQNDLVCPCPPRLSYPGQSQLTQPTHLPCPLHLPRADNEWSIGSKCTDHKLIK